jgi:hypothetical protein
MTEQEVHEIYNRLLELTKAGKIQWKRTGEEEFITSFSRSSVTIEIEYLADQGGYAVLKIFNDAGLMVAHVSPMTGLGIVDSGVKEFNLDPSELFNLVQDEVYKYSQTSRSILDELKELELSQKGR